MAPGSPAWQYALVAAGSALIAEGFRWTKNKVKDRIKARRSLGSPKQTPDRMLPPVPPYEQQKRLAQR